LAWLVAFVPIASATGAPDDLDALTLEALGNNPALAALRARTAELRSLAQAAGTWRDPVLKIDYLNAPIDTFDLNKKPQSGLQVNLAQAIPPRGWSRASTQVARRQVETSRLAVAEAENQLRRDVRLAYHQLTLSRQLEGVTRTHIARTEELLRAVRARYETGRAGQHQLLRLQLLRDRLEEDLLDFESRDRELAAQLQRLLSRPGSASFEVPLQVEARAVPGPIEAWRARALEARPELERLESAARAAEAAAELARIEASPDKTFHLAYRRRTVDLPIDDGTDQFTAAMTIPIPIGSAKRSSARQLAQERVARRERAQRAAMVDQIDAGLVAAHSRWTRAFDKTRVFERQLLPAARLAVETTLAEFSVGSADFATLYQAEVDLLDLERSLIRAAIQTHIEAAELEALVGVRLEGGAP